MFTEILCGIIVELAVRMVCKILDNIERKKR